MTNTRMSVLIAPVAGALTLVGCMMGPNYVRPAAEAPAAYKEAAGWKVAQPQDNVARGQWWAIFGDAKLDELEAQVDISNQNLKVAEANVRQAQALTQAARAALFPAVTGNVNATRSKPPTGGQIVNTPGIRNNYNVALDASWEIDLWGSIRRNVESREASAQASVANLEVARLSAQALLAQDYWLLRVADAEIVLLNETVAAYEKSLQLTRNQYAAGVVGRNDVVQAETQVDAGAGIRRWRAARATRARRRPSHRQASVRCFNRSASGAVGLPRHPDRHAFGVARASARRRGR